MNKKKLNSSVMIALVTVVILLVSSFDIRLADKSEPAFHFFTEDSIDVEVVALFEHDSVLSGYKAYVFSPVCEDTTCYPVELEFYWDVLGRYQKYEVFPGRGLTKLDHKPFTDADYKTLSKLMLNNSPAFLELKREDLVVKVKKDTVDGYTGATIAAIKNEVIPGAVYSCYTLWHIANGIVADSIKNNTQRHFNPILLKSLFNSGDVEAAYYLIGRLNEDQFVTYLPEILKLLRESEGYLAQHILDQIPQKIVSSESFQDSMVAIMPDLDYYAQKSLLRRLDGTLTSDKLGKVLAESIEPRGSLHNELIIKIFCDNNTQLNTVLYESFFLQLLTKQVTLNKTQSENIKNLVKSDKQLKPFVKNLKQNGLLN
ncbi:MAG: hypothetical protein ACK5M7_06425 [Draconibacterium sp.]